MIENKTDEVILKDTGYLQNIIQKSVKVQSLTLTLYSSHLKIQDTKSGEIIEDVAINQIEKTSKYFTSRFQYTLYGFFVKSNIFFVKTHKKKYKISWVGKDAEKVFLGATDATILSDQQNYDKNMAWSKAIKELKTDNN